MTPPAPAADGAYERVSALCDSTIALIAGRRLARDAEAIRDRLHGPLRVAIAGRAKAGKSTLLNALVGERLAATDAGECTRIVTFYRQGLGYSVTAVGRDGDRRPLSFRRRDAGLEIDLGPLQVAEIDRLDIEWPTSALAAMTLIDTPGLESMNAENSTRAQEFLSLDDGRSSEADAVIYVMRHLHHTDARFMDSFLDRSVGSVSPVNAVAVLSRADEIGACRLDAMQSAARIAERYRNNPDVGSLCATVVPVAGLLAETALTLREDEVAALRAISATALESLRLMLLSTDGFCDAALGSVPVETRRDLLTRFGMFGLRATITELRAGRIATAPRLSVALLQLSGLPALRAVLSEQFLPKTRVLKARSALVALRRLTRELASEDQLSADRLATEIEREESASHEFAELRLAHLVMTGAVRLSGQEEVEARRITGAADIWGRAGLPADAPTDALQSAALEGIERWRTRAEDPSTDRLTAEVSTILARSYEGLYAAASGVRD